MLGNRTSLAPPVDNSLRLKADFEEVFVSLRACGLLLPLWEEEEAHTWFLALLRETDDDVTEETDADISQFLIWILNFMAR